MRRFRDSGVVLMALAALAGCQRGAGDYVTRGKEALAAGKPAEAALLLRNAVQKDPKNFDATLQLAIASRRQADIPAATAASVRATELNPKSTEAWALAGQIAWDTYMLGVRQQESLYQAERAAKHLLEMDPESVEGLKLKGLLAMARRQPVQAAESFRRAAAQRPGDHTLVLSQAQNLLAAGDEAKAIGLIEGILAADAKYFAAYDTLYGHYLATGRMADAERMMRRKADSIPGEPSYALQLAEHYHRSGNMAEREKALGRLSGVADGWMRIGEFHAGHGDWQAAERAFRQGLAARPAEAVAYQTRIAGSLASQDKMGEALALLDELIRKTPDSGELLAQRGNFRLANGDRAGAIADLRQASDGQPAEAKYRNDLAAAHYQDGNLEAAESEYRNVLKNRPSQADALIGMAEVFTKRMQFREAGEFVDQYLKVRPGDPRGLLLLSVIQVGTGYTSTALATLRKLVYENPGDREAALQLGLVLTSVGRHAEAEAIFQRFLQQAGRDPRPAAGLARIWASQGRFGEAIGLLRKSLPSVLDPLALRREIASIAMQGGRHDEAIGEMRAVVEGAPGDPRALLELGQMCLEAGRPAEALKALERARQTAPGSAEAAGLYAMALQESGRTQEAEREFRAALKIAPEDAGLNNNFGYFLAETGSNLDEALACARKAIAGRPGVSQFDDTLGWIHLKRNEVQAALDRFRKIAREYPNNAQYRYHLGLALAQSGDRAAGRRELMAALEAKPVPAEAARIRRSLEGLAQ